MRRVFSVLLILGFILGLSGLVIADNEVYFTQSGGSPNQLYVQQVGDDNNIGTSEDPFTQTTATGSNIAGDEDNPITQKGNNNSLMGSQTAYEGNTLYSSQEGDENSIELSQTSSYGSNYADIKQITEVASNNSLTASQKAEGSNELYSYQKGDGNSIELTQEGKIAPSAGSNYADLTQIGNGNTMNIKQYSDDSNYAEAYQEGDGNSLTALQEAEGPNGLYSYQEGDGNSINLTQGQQTENSYVSNYANLEQIGDENTMNIEQYSDGSNYAGGWWGYLIQWGNKNSLTALQIGTDYNWLYSFQVGNENSIELTQKGQNGDCASSNYADLGQIGDENTMNIEQYSDGSNYAEAYQEGDGNSLTALQIGTDYNDLYSYQVSDGNSINLEQMGLSGPCALSNYAELTQLGNGHTMNIVQHSDGANIAIVSQ